MNKRQISAEIIADSKNEFGARITTFVLVFPRIVLAEFNTHRMLSRNSASSRAIPFEKMLKMVQEDPFIPIAWMKDHPGMQGNEYFDESEIIDLNIEFNWLEARDAAVKMANMLSKTGVTKQIVNRLLEPFMWHTVIATATNWQNFFALRAHPAAEIHIQKLAHIMLEEYNKSEPKLLQPGEWHIPFGDKIDEERLQVCHNYDGTKNLNHDTSGRDTLALKIATARCARISYNNFEGKDDYAADILLHDRLVAGTPKHASPAEHCAQSMEKIDMDDEFGSGGWSGNFYGFKQYRKMLENENATDPRVLQK